MKRVGLKAGKHFLDVAGGLRLPSAGLVAKVLATDCGSPEMIRRFEMRVCNKNISDAKGQVMEGHHLEL